MKAHTKKVDTLRKQFLMKAHTHESIVTEEMAKEHYRSCPYCQEKMKAYDNDVAVE